MILEIIRKGDLHIRVVSHVLYCFVMYSSNLPYVLNVLYCFVMILVMI